MDSPYLLVALWSIACGWMVAVGAGEARYCVAPPAPLCPCSAPCAHVPLWDASGHAPSTPCCLKSSCTGSFWELCSSACCPDIPAPFRPAGTDLGAGLGSPQPSRVHKGLVGSAFPSGRSVCSWLQAVNWRARTFLPGLCMPVLSQPVSLMSQFLFFPFLTTSMQLVHPLVCAGGWRRAAETHVHVSDAEERRSCYKYSSAVFLLTFQFYNPFQKIWTKIP